MEKAIFIHFVLKLYKRFDTNEKVASRGNNVFLEKMKKKPTPYFTLKAACTL